MMGEEPTSDPPLARQAERGANLSYAERRSRRPYRGRRSAPLMTLDGLLVLASFWSALLLRFDGSVPLKYARTMLWCGPVIVVLLLGVSLLTRLNNSLPSYVSVEELLRVAVVVGVTGGVVISSNEIYALLEGRRLEPLSTSIVGTLILFMSMALVRSYVRITAVMQSRRTGRSGGYDRVLIVGAGGGGERVARELTRDPGQPLQPVGFLDDDPRKLGKRIHGLPVIGPINSLSHAVAQTSAHCVVVAMPGQPSPVVEEALRLVAQCGLKAKILPSLGEMMNPTRARVGIRDVDVSDLIARPLVKIETDKVTAIFEGRTVLVTGAAGSIGSELARRALYFKPAKLLLLDNNESDLFALNRHLMPMAGARGIELEMILADVRDGTRIERIFQSFRPQLVFHAAAYKHVPIMEAHPEESVVTNVSGTRIVAEASSRFGAERFVLVSTDKAVNPTSVMGATKRVAEMLTSSLVGESLTMFTSVRFGNVLASRGSVVPIFLEQIRDGGPITVTHPDTTRYFMTIPEAVDLIFQAGALGRGGETFVLEMGEPVRILDLADRMRRLMASGDARTVDIVITGLRPGEKLHEELRHSYEHIEPVHPSIMRVAPCEANSSRLWDKIAELEALAAGGCDPKAVVTCLFNLVRHEETQPAPTLLSAGASGSEEPAPGATG